MSDYYKDKVQVHVWIDLETYTEYKMEADEMTKELGTKVGVPNRVKADLVSQAKIKRQLRQLRSQTEVQQPTRKLSAWEQLNIDIQEG